MKILFISDNFPPESNAPATRTFEHCRSWVEKGAEVTVVTCCPNFPKGEVYRGYKNKLYQCEMMDGIKVVRLWSFMAPNAGFSLRVLDFISFSLSALFYCSFIKFDLVITTSPQFFTNFTGMFLKLIRRKPWVAEIRDLWPESIRSVGVLNNQTIYNILECFELLFYRYCNNVVVVTNSFKRNLIERKVDPEKIHVIYNGVGKDLIGVRNKEKRKYKIKKILAYIGTHGMAHNLDFILDNAKEAESRYPNLHFLFVGDGSEKIPLVEKARKLGLKNVEFRDPVPNGEVQKVLSEVDYGLINLTDSSTFLTVIPSKMFEISAAGKPIFMGVAGEAKEIVLENRAGLCFQPNNRDSFLEKLEILLDEESQKNYFCRFLLAKKFDRKKQAEKMYNLLDNLKLTKQ